MHKFHSIASLRPNPRRKSRQEYYKANAEKIKPKNSARYKQQALAEREIPDGFASPAPKLPPVPKVAARLQKPSKKQRHRQNSSREGEVADGADEGVVDQSRRSFIRSQKTGARKQRVQRESQKHKRSESARDGKNKLRIMAARINSEPYNVQSDQ